MSGATSNDHQVHSLFELSKYTPPDYRKFLCYWIGLVISCLAAFLFAASQLEVKPLQFQAPIPGSYGNFYPDVKLIAEALSVDPIARTIAMNWYPDFTSISCHSAQTPVAVDIYLASVLLDTSSPSWSSQLQDQPAYRLNTTSSCFGLISAYSSFRTVTKLIASKDYIVVQSILHQSSFQNYPFDVYLAPFFFYTRNLETGVISPLEVADSFGVAVNFKITLVGNGHLVRNGIVDNLQFFLRIERSMATKAFVVMVAITNWLMAIAFLTICAATVVYRPHKIYSEMFVVPVGALFAFSSIRSNLPGAPAGFGATIDMFAILPVLIIMSLCSFALLIIILYRRISQEVHEEERMSLPKSAQMSDQVKETATQTPRLPNFIALDAPHFQSQRSSSDITRTEEHTIVIDSASD